MITVLVVDDHAYVRAGLEQLIAQTPDIEVVAACADGWEALAAALLTDPDVVLMDLVMPGMTGLETTRHLRACCPDARVVVLSGSVTGPLVCEAQQAGVAGYLLKDDDPAQLPQQIRAVAAGHTVWSPAAAAHHARCP